MSPSATSTSQTFVRPTFDDVYATTLRPVWRMARRLGVPEGSIEDVAQDVFVAAYRQLDQFVGECTEQTWVIGILLRVVRNYHRARRHKAAGYAMGLALGDPESLPDDRDPFEILSQREAGRVVRTLLGKLSEKHARAFVMAELEGMTAEEIAARTYANVSTVHSRIRNARLQIARHAASFRQRDLRGLPSKPAGARSEAQPLRYDSAGAARDSFASEALS